MDQEEVVHIYNGILLSHEKDKRVPLAETRVDRQTIILSEVN